MEDWEAEHDLHTLHNAHEIQKDSGRMERVQKHANSMHEAAHSMSHPMGGRGNEQREGDFDKDGTLSREEMAHEHTARQNKVIDEYSEGRSLRDNVFPRPPSSRPMPPDHRHGKHHRTHEKMRKE